jgi:predicted ester cyclase
MNEDHTAIRMSRQQIETLFDRRDAAIARRDAEEIAAQYAEDAVVESPTAGGAVRGRSAVAEITRAWFVGIPDLVMARTLLIIDGDRAVWMGDVSGTDSGGFMGLAPTNKPFHLPIVMVCTLKDGFIVHEQRIYDFTGMLVQIGVLKARPI